MQDLGNLCAQVTRQIADWLDNPLSCPLNKQHSANRSDDQDHEYPNHQDPREQVFIVIHQSILYLMLSWLLAY